MLANAVYFGWQFMESGQVKGRSALVTAVQEGKPIQLLAERHAVTQENSTEEKEIEAEESAPVVAVQPPAVKLCYSIGPFTSEDTAQKWVTQMQDKRFGATIDKRKVESKDYWVFIPAFTNRLKAEERLKEIKAQGVDSFIVKEGVFANAISLNHFSQKDKATAYQQKMQGVGIAAEFREISQSGAEIWVFVSPGGAKSDLRSVIDDFLVKKPDLKRENSACTE
jgi:hypothetical protein